MSERGRVLTASKQGFCAGKKPNTSSSLSGHSLHQSDIRGLKGAKRLLKILPSPLMKGRGIKGEGFRQKSYIFTAGNKGWGVYVVGVGDIMVCYG